jgi:beta-alanine--pyruvate transaminase
VLIPPKGYLQKLRAICDKHGILLIFDEVITGFGRLGTPFAADYFGVVPDMITCAKGLTNGVVPMGAVFVQARISTTPSCAAPEAHDRVLPRLHLFGQPAGLGAMHSPPWIPTAKSRPAERAAELAPYFEEALHACANLPCHRHPQPRPDRRHRTVAGPGKPTKRAFDVFLNVSGTRASLIRTTGDIIALSPPLIIQFRPFVGFADGDGEDRPRHCRRQQPPDLDR